MVGQNELKKVATCARVEISELSSCIELNSFTNHLLSITRQICKSFDDSHEVQSVFLGMSKAFDKVWHKVFQIEVKWYLKYTH